MVACPICEKPVREANINRHIDSDCNAFLDEPSPPPTQITTNASSAKTPKLAGFFTPAARKSLRPRTEDASSPISSTQIAPAKSTTIAFPSTAPAKRARDEDEHDQVDGVQEKAQPTAPPTKKPKNAHQPLAERMRPQSLDQVAGQELVGSNGVLRNLIVTDRVPSMILWGGPGTGKTTIARLIAQTAGTRFVEINSTSSGVAECKKLFAEAKNELALTGRKTIIFCDEIHRFSKSQQDVFLGPVEAGQVTLIGATTENPSFKVVNALLSRCRTFTLAKLSDEHIFGILKRALSREVPSLPTPSPSPSSEEQVDNKEDVPNTGDNSLSLLTEDDYSLVRYLAAFADGDARTGLNLLELALDLCKKPGISLDDVKKSLTQTLVYDRAGDQHYDTISAFHKSVRGSNADAALYYLARMLQSGEDPLYVARRMVVIASEDVGIADNSLLSLATATYTAAEKIGMPECRINLAHCTVALCQAPKSVRAYRGLNAAYAALNEPGVAGLPVPVHLRNAPTKLMKELGYGKEYKYNPDFKDGRVVQDYLPDKLEGRVFLKSEDLGKTIDPDVAELDEELRYAEELERGEELLLNPDGD
ncbi:ATPase WRNIP1 [Fulvia fulva]|uniref:ATPase WRNIP1 n=1 Tax=Passalora fulva TaxID=5499 RepID=A0A9Q8PHI9_PASFU|nr:ATPase WRNIP1 [Fulvia fulva]KAK4616233.1 ATPase WRNIP1 [Fulvia fulva]KAK4617217.1 ATPase WRNIP1 [Fulvia fulva]UJO22531.1 ATPase WRNIP1 [Fulvia fulva]WPV19436.1 ATPase WRNIP1 [Fulvia fulva]WPV34071.1 ATPase WRNIP1 [Fulvia fulva]